MTRSRYACDGLLKNRLRYSLSLKLMANFKLVVGMMPLEFITDNTKGFTGDKVFGAVGDLVDVESMYMFKKFFKDVLSFR